MAISESHFLKPPVPTGATQTGPVATYLLIAVLVLAAVLVVRKFWRKPPGRRACQWRRAGFAHAPGMQAWECRKCSQRAWTKTGKHPTTCMRGLKTPSL